MSDVRSWDSYQAYLFDIDGTLLNCTDAVHYFAFCNTLQMLAGRPLNLDGVVAHGNTDTGILRDALQLAGISDAAWRPRLPEAYAAMCADVEANKADLRVTVLPGVTDVLQHLHRREACVGVATGNLAGIGQLKLEAGGLLQHFDFLGFSDGFEARSEVFAAALRKARTLTYPDATVCVVGDTPSDIAAARANGLDVIAVATGVYAYEQLLQCEPTVCIRSLADLLRPAM